MQISISGWPLLICSKVYRVYCWLLEDEIPLGFHCSVTESRSWWLPGRGQGNVSACFCRVRQFLLPEEISVTEFGKRIAILLFTGFLSPFDPFKKQPVFFLILVGEQDKQNSNDHTFSSHSFLNVHCFKICALWGIQYSAFAPNFCSNHSLFLISCEVSFH